MRFLTILTLSSLGLALAGCNGGEDFSDATVAGCPAGAGCDPRSRGEVLVELVGPRVANLGYRCGGTNVVFNTEAIESTSVNSDGQAVTVPAYNALCPASSQDVEFFIGNGLFEGNSVSLGKILLPKQEALQRYVVTVADLNNSPWRESSDLPQTRNVAALIQGLDADFSTSDIIEIPNAAHDILDDMPELAEPLNTELYDEFRDQWSVGEAGSDTYFEIVDDAVAGGIAGLNLDPDVPLAKVKAANRYTAAGNYSFRSCLFITCRNAADDIVSVNLPGRLSNDSRIGEWPLILPNGKIMGVGFAARATSSTGSVDAEQELVAFSKDSRVNDLLQLENARVVSIEDGSNATDLAVQGRFLNKLMYNDYLPENGVGSTDIELNYPTVADSLSPGDRGALSGELLSSTVPDDDKIPLTAEIEAAPQAEPDQATIDMLASNGPYTMRLMRACLEGANEPAPAECSPIPNPSEEVKSDGSGNYFPINGKDVTDEQPRGDFYDNSTEICLEVLSDVGEPNNGIIIAGPSDGSCPTALEQYEIGFVSRTFINAGSNVPESANLTFLVAPDAANPPGSSHFGVTVLGRVDLTASCSPMYRTGDPNFNAGLRAVWVDDFYPYVQQKEWIEDLGPAPEGQNYTVADLPEAQQEMLVAISTGAVQFFAGQSGDSCDPLAP